MRNRLLETSPQLLQEPIVPRYAHGQKDPEETSRKQQQALWFATAILSEQQRRQLGTTYAGSEILGDLSQTDGRVSSDTRLLIIRGFSKISQELTVDDTIR